ncbi:MAG: hypothetical protein AB1690_09645 [Candidatus Zixiibacteriota bacterium]
MKAKITGVLVLSFLTAFAMSEAEVVVKMTMSIDMMGMASQKSEMTQYIGSDRVCVESKGDPSLVAAASGGAGNTEITRLDKGVIWTVDPKKKQYTETTLESVREMMKQFSEMDREMPGADTDEEYDWKVETEGPVADRFKSFDCQRFKATATGTKKDDPEDKTVVQMEYWIGQNLTGMDEMQKYYENYAKAVGMDEAGFNAQIEQAASKYKKQFGDFFEKIKKAGGYPVKVSMVVKNSGGDDMSAMMGEAMEKAAEEMDEEEQEAKAKMAEMMSKMGLSPEKMAKSKSEDGMTTVMAMDVEILDIKEEAVAPSVFEVPEGFKLQPKF